MLMRSIMISVSMLLMVSGAQAQQDQAKAQQDRSEYEAKLKAGREAAYKKFLLVADSPQVNHAPPATGAALAVLPTQVGRAGDDQAQAAPMQSVLGNSAQTQYIFREHPSPVYSGNLRELFYDDLNVRRGGRYADYPIGPYVFQPLYDSRYRRSWPRPVVMRQYVKSHWLWNGQRYTFVPGHAEYQTQWITRGWPRYHWNGSHYSVSVSYR